MIVGARLCAMKRGRHLEDGRVVLGNGTRRVAKDLPSLTHGGITMRATVAGICAGALLAGAV
jgi:hypothetical protein